MPRSWRLPGGSARHPADRRHLRPSWLPDLTCDVTQRDRTPGEQVLPIERGPLGGIGTNRGDAAEAVASLVSDANGR